MNNGVIKKNLINLKKRLEWYRIIKTKGCSVMEKYNHEYNAEQIQVLEGLEAVRKDQVCI